jgi:hypothetical protein
MTPREETPAGAAMPWHRRWATGRNRYTLTELAGAFGDLGTLIPFVVGYLAVTGMDPLGILFAFGLSQIVVGLYYKTPIPVQPMKAIAGAAIAAGGAISPGMICGAGLFTGVFWLLAGATRSVNLVTRLATKPIVRGIMLGLGLLFMSEGVRLMLVTPWLAGLGLVTTFVLLTWRRIPAMFALLVLGAVAAYFLDPALARQVLHTRPDFRLPDFTVARISWGDFLAGTLVLAIPQIPLTMGNAIIAIRAENNELFPERPVTEPRRRAARWDSAVPRRRRHGRPRAVRCPHGRLAGHARRHPDGARPLLQSLGWAAVSDLPQGRAGRDPVLRRDRARHHREGHRPQEGGRLRDAGGCRLRDVEHGRRVPRRHPAPPGAAPGLGEGLAGVAPGVAVARRGQLRVSPPAPLHLGHRCRDPDVGEDGRIGARSARSADRQAGVGSWVPAERRLDLLVSSKASHRYCRSERGAILSLWSGPWSPPEV